MSVFGILLLFFFTLTSTLLVIVNPVNKMNKLSEGMTQRVYAEQIHTNPEMKTQRKKYLYTILFMIFFGGWVAPFFVITTTIDQVGNPIFASIALLVIAYWWYWFYKQITPSTNKSQVSKQRPNRVVARSIHDTSNAPFQVVKSGSQYSITSDSLLLQILRLMSKIVNTIPIIYLWYLLLVQLSIHF